MPDYKASASDSHYGTRLGTKNDFDILDCENCEFIHASEKNNRLKPDLYSSHYYEQEKPDYICSNIKDATWWDFTYGMRIDQVDKLRIDSAINWLDIGTGPGNFLDAAVKRGKKVKGIEPSSAASVHASSKGHEVINAYFDQGIASGLEKFQGIHCSEVLEHVPNPKLFLGAIRDVMDSDSILCIVVPNDFNIIQKIYSESYKEIEKWWMAPPFHLNYFTPESLRKLLNQNGYEVIYETSMFPIDIFLLMGDHYIGNDILGKEAHERRKNMEFAFLESGQIEILKALYEGMHKLGIGRELVFYSKLAR